MLLLLLLAACAAPPAPGLRDPAVPVRSIAGFDPARLVGDWHEAAHIARPGAAACAPGTLSFRRDGAALRVDGRLCRAGMARALSAPVRVTGPGRLSVAGESWWVLWADHGDRTLVLADPAGGFAVVLDRGRIAPDRLAAAREVLAFNGFDPALLR